MSLRPRELMLVIVLASGPAAAQETCGKLYESQDCGPAFYEEALARSKEAAAKLQQMPPAPIPSTQAPTVPEPGGAVGEEVDLRQRAMELYRARMGAMVNSGMCCHPTPNGMLRCH